MMQGKKLTREYVKIDWLLGNVEELLQNLKKVKMDYPDVESLDIERKGLRFEDEAVYLVITRIETMEEWRERRNEERKEVLVRTFSPK